MLRLTELEQFVRMKDEDDDNDSGLGGDSPPPSPGVEWGSVATAAAAVAEATVIGELIARLCAIIRFAFTQSLSENLLINLTLMAFLSFCSRAHSLFYSIREASVSTFPRSPADPCITLILPAPLASY